MTTKKRLIYPLKKYPSDPRLYARLKRMIHMRWTLELTLETIGQKCGISRERVRQVLVEHVGNSGPRAPYHPIRIPNYPELHMLEYWETWAGCDDVVIARNVGCTLSHAKSMRSRVYPTPHAVIMSTNKYLIKQGKKLCSHCKEPVLLEDFHSGSGRSGGVQPTCKICLRRWFNARNRARKEGVILTMYLYRLLPSDHRWLAPPTRGKYATIDHTERIDRAIRTPHAISIRSDR